MAERAGSGGGHPTTEQIELLSTKVTIPRVRAGALQRTRLLEALDRALEKRLAVLCTPAGFGKTTLLADWVRRNRPSAAWLSLDPEDNDPIRFWRYVVEAFDRAEVEFDRHVGLAVRDRTATSDRGIVIALANSLATLPDDVVLVLDDYHAIESAQIHDGLAYLLEHIPDRLHVIVASRTDPPLPVARLRGRDDLMEFRASALRFTADESAAFLRDVWGLELSDASVAAVESRTEGWAVGLQFAALSLAGRSDPAAFLDAFTGSHRYVLEYLSEEVLDRQTEETRSFLLRSSILERLSGPLCDALTGRSDGRETLERLERANLFIVPLDETRRWYRFHHLFRDLLRAQLERWPPELVSDLHHRAASWAEDHGLVDDAIRHTLAAGRPDRAGALVEQRLAETFRRGETVTLKRWLSGLPGEVVRSLPGSCVASAIMATHLGRLAEAERFLDDAERAASAPSEGAVFPTNGGMVTDVEVATALIRSEIASARGDAVATARFAAAALARTRPEDHGPRLWARWLGSLADWIGGASGRIDEVEGAFARLLEEAKAWRDPHPLTTSCHTLGWVQQSRGRLGAALATYRDGLRFATEGGRVLPFHAGEAHLGMAQILYARDQLSEALEHATRAVELTRQMVEFQLSVFGLVAVARIRYAMGERTSALSVIDEACRLLPATEVVSMWDPAEVERARLLLAQGRLDDVERWLSERGIGEGDDLSYPREADHLILARVLLARRRPDRANELLKRLDAMAESGGRVGSLIELRALRSLTLQASGHREEALAMLERALSLARPEGYVRAFIDEGPSMAALLRRLLRARAQDADVDRAAYDHAMRIARAFRVPADAHVASTLVEPLTRRELEVLGLLATGRSNREIADELVVTLDTVKRHVSHIFAKLGSSNRTEAVARARELDLIQ